MSATVEGALVERQEEGESCDQKESEQDIMEAVSYISNAGNGGKDPSPPVQGPPQPPSSHPPFPTLPDFMTALNMQPTIDNTRNNTPSGGGGGVGQEGVVIDESPLPPPSPQEDTKIESIGPGETLIERFKQDPSGVLNLLQSAISMERLSGLLKEEHRNDEELLSQLQNRLEVAYHTLKECQENKTDLATKISETNERICGKRKHLEILRGELKILGDEELKLKRKRDASQTKFSELKKKLKCSTEALQQLSQITELSGSDSGNLDNNFRDS